MATYNLSVPITQETEAGGLRMASSCLWKKGWMRREERRKKWYAEKKTYKFGVKAAPDWSGGSAKSREKRDSLDYSCGKENRLFWYEEILGKWGVDALWLERTFPSACCFRFFSLSGSGALP